METTTTIMVSPETHNRLLVCAANKKMYVQSFFEWLYNNQKPVFTGKNLSVCDSVINVTPDLRDNVKLSAIKSRVSMGRYIEGLLEGYCGTDILE